MGIESLIFSLFSRKRPAKEVLISQMAKLPPIADIWAQKGGTGKSSVTGALAIELTRRGLRVAVVDCDVDSPYFAEFFGLTEPMKLDENNRFIPAVYQHHDPDGTLVGAPIKVVSSGLFPSGSNKDKVYGAISKQGDQYAPIIVDMFSQTVWGDIDIILADSPAGTSDIFRAILKVAKGNLLGSFVVMLPYITTGLQRVIDLAVVKGNPILGVIENQYDLYPPRPGKPTIEGICQAGKVKYLGHIPHIPGYQGPEMPRRHSLPIRKAATIIQKELKA